MPNLKPLYPTQFGEQMVELVRAGKKPAELAKEFCYHATSILNWVRLADEASGVALPNLVPSTPPNAKNLCAAPQAAVSG